MVFAVERERAVQHVRIGIQMIAPELLTDHHHTGCPGTVFPRKKSASFEWGNAKDRKEVRADADTRNALRRSHSAQREAPASTVKHRNLFERLLPVTPRQEIGSPHGSYPGLSALVRSRNNEALRLGIGQWPKYDCIDQAELSRVSA